MPSKRDEAEAIRIALAAFAVTRRYIQNARVQVMALQGIARPSAKISACNHVLRTVEAAIEDAQREFTTALEARKVTIR